MDILGTPGDDVLIGTPDNDAIDGYSGNDQIDGLPGDDLLRGGAGDDTIDGREGNDTIEGGEGNDIVRGGEGNDTIDAGLGQNNADGEAGNDLLIVDYSINPYIGSGSGLSSTLLSNGSGGFNGAFSAPNSSSSYDSVGFSNIERFRITGTAANDTIRTGDGDDTLNGGAGNDILNGGGGNDTINGGDGNDTITGGAGNDAIDGGAGIDVLTDADFSTATANLSFNDNGSTQASVALANGDSVSGVEYIDGVTTGSGNDTISFTTSRNNTINTGAGDDVINAGLGSDAVDGGDGNDLLIVDYSSNSYTGSGSGINSSISSNGSGGFNGAFSAANSSSSSDSVGFTNIERFRITGTAANDTIRTGDGDDTIIGGDGNDILNGGGGNDTIIGGDGNDTITGGAGNDVIDGGAGVDVLTDADFSTATTNLSFTDNGSTQASVVLTNGNSVSGIEYIDNLTTGTGNDTISFTTLRNNVINTGAGDDAINAGLGSDTVDGGAGNDLLIVDYSSNPYTGSGSGILYNTFNSNGSGGFNGSFIAYNSSGSFYDYFISFSNIERFQITGTVANDTIRTGDGNDILVGGGGDDTLEGGKGNDTYRLNALNAAGSSIQDGGGTDSLILENAQIALEKAQSGKIGIGRLGANLIVDLNQNGVLNPDTDLSILNFYSDRFGNSAGSGFLETIGNISGQNVLGLQLLDTDNITDIGSLRSSQTFNDFVGSSDPEDFYRFHLDADSQVNLSVNNSNLDMRLLYTSGGFQNIVAGGQSIQKNLFAGTYFVVLRSGIDSNYALEASAQPVSDSAGNTLGNARDLGFLVGAQTFNDSLSDDIDPVDFYRFELSKPSTVNFSTTISLDIQLLDQQGSFISRNSSGNQLEAGTYYLRVQSNGLNTNYNLNLEAIPSTALIPLQIREVTPNAGSNGGITTISVEGTQFTSSAKLTLIAPDGTTRQASQVTWYDATTLTGTFNLQGLPTGAYDVRVEDVTGTITSNDTFTVNNQPVFINPLFNNDNLEVSLTVPDALRPWWVGEATVTYRNTGSSDIIAPLLTLNLENAKLRLTGTQEFTNTSLQFLAGGSDSVTGVLSPGETGTFTAFFLPDSSSTDLQVNFSVGTAKLGQEVVGSSSAQPSYQSTTLDWASIKPTLKPESISDAAWDVIWTNFTQSVGTTVEQYQSVLAQNATYLSQLGETTNDVSRLLAFELLQADNFGNISQRFTDSVLGKGQVSAWEISVSSDTNGNVTVKQAGLTRPFKLQPNGTYSAEKGDEGTLTLVGGRYQLKESNGTKTVFRADGKFDYIEDANSNRIQATYADNRLTQVSYSNGDSLAFAYNAQGRISQVTDQAGQVTSYSYDATGEHLLSFATPNGTTSYTYITAPGASQHAVSSITYADGAQSFFEYDSQGRLTRQSLNGGAEALNYSYDSLGGITITDASGATTKQFLNDRGQIARVIDPLNRGLQYRYDSNGNLTQVVAPGDTVNSFTYDAKGNLISSSDSLGHRVDFTYEPTYDQLASVRDQKGNLTGYSYDAKGNLNKLTYADGSSETFGYDSHGNLTVSANRRNQTIQYTYDAKFQLIRKDYPDGSSATFSYDSRGNLLTAADGDSSTSFTYDSADRLTRVTEGHGRFVAYSYDAAGRRTQMADQSGNVVNYSYDAVGRLSRLTDSSNALIASYTYDAVGRLSRSDNGNGTYTTYSYDAAGQQLGLVNYKTDNTVNSRFDYTYDALGRRTSMTTLEGTTTYGYDATGQLTSVNLPTGRTIQYQYDAAGNRIAVTDSGTTTSYSTNNLNQYTTAGGATYTYDKDGNLIAKTEGGNTSTYTYDAENRLISVTTLNGTWTYEYDALSNRIASTRNGQRTEYLLDPSGLVDVVGEYDGSGNVIASYVHGLGLESRISVGAQDYYDFDAIGSVAGLTGTSGNYLNRYSYLPFGENLTTTESIANPFEYVGQWGVMDEGNGLDFMRARYFAPGIGRFTSEDPIGLQSNDANFYRYVFNNPTTLRDPSGKSPDSDYLDDLERRKSKVDFAAGTIGGIAGIVGLANPIAGGVLGGFALGLGLGFNIPYYYNERERTNVIRSTDPNDVVGPAGFGTQGWLIPNQPLPYMIRFENAEDASAPAVFVTVTQQLDPDLDWDTFQLGDFGFGSFYINVPDGFQSYSARVDARDTLGYFVDFDASLNKTTGQVTWKLTTIDPVTGQLPTDVFAGFLPPNDKDTHSGEGFVNYNIQAKPNLANGTQLTAEASIIFDTNDPINTPVHLNTVDQGAPSSSVLSLPATTSTNTFTLSWAGSDAGSGIANYDIYVSVDSGDFTPLLEDTTATSTTFTADVGRTYRFYSVATDNVGRRENLPVTADAVTTIALSNRPPITQANKVLTLDEDAAPMPLNITVPTDPDNDALTIQITNLPDPTKGILRLGDVPLTANTPLTPSQLSQLVFVPVANANGNAGTFGYTVSDGKGGTATQTITLEITPIDDPATLAFSSANFSVNEDGTAIAAVTVTRNGGDIQGSVGATIALTDGTATAPGDYNNAPIPISFAQGEASKTIIVPIVDDTLIENNETINLVLDSPTAGATIGAQNTATLTVIDNDMQLVFSKAQFSVNENGTSVNAVTITRTGRTTGEVGATLTLTNGTATAQDDYDNTPLTVKFADGQTSQTVVIPIIDDTTFEGDETVNLALSNPTNGATLGTQNTAVLTIVDNDQTLTGTNGNDSLTGTAGNNTFVGVNATSTTPGRNESDRFTGGGGGDRFILGDATRVYYDDVSRRSAGTSDYALITDFNATEGDVIQLKGLASNYVLGTSPVSTVAGTGIFLTAGQLTPELIGIVQNTTLTNFDRGFAFV